MSSISQAAARRPLLGRLHWPTTVIPIEEAAKRFGLHPTTIYRYVRLGYLKKYKRRLDRRTYIDSKALGDLQKGMEFEERK